MANIGNAPEIISTKGIVRILGCGRSYFYKRHKKNLNPVLKEKSVYYMVDEVLAYKNRLDFNQSMYRKVG
jgi:hypothetical protein